MTLEQWEGALKQVRDPLGAISSRTLLGAQYQTELPGAPKGEYEVIQFRVELANKSAVIETVTSMIDKDGKWRVGGYFIRPVQ